LIISRINEKLLLYLDHDKTALSLFKKALKESNSVITGSIIIQCILDVDWEHNNGDNNNNNYNNTKDNDIRTDIDVYVQANEIKDAVNIDTIKTIDDVVDIIDQENTEDFHKMAAMQPNEEQYLKTSVLKLAKGRITWLLVLMISASLTGSIIQKFDEILQSVVILAAFIPMLMDTGGNSGSQSATLVIRGMALGEIQIKDYLKVMWKEFKVSLIVASILSVFNFIRIYFIVKTDLMISITVCISLFFTIVLAKVVGGTLPIVAKKLKFDPAIMASPFITTIVDTFSLIVYFTLAKMFLGIQ